MKSGIISTASRFFLSTMEQREERLNLFRLSRVVREEGEANDVAVNLCCGYSAMP